MARSITETTLERQVQQTLQDSKDPNRSVHCSLAEGFTIIDHFTRQPRFRKAQEAALERRKSTEHTTSQTSTSSSSVSSNVPNQCSNRRSLSLSSSSYTYTSSSSSSSHCSASQTYISSLLPTATSRIFLPNNWNNAHINPCTRNNYLVHVHQIIFFSYRR